MKIINYSELTPEIAAKGCLVSGIPNDAYHAYDGISKSGLDLIDRSPAHYAFAGKREATRAMVIGSAAHAAVLEPELFANEYMLLNAVKDRRSSAYKEAVKQYGADNVLTGKEADSITGMQQAISMNADAVKLLGLPGNAELAAFATDPKTGVLVKCKFDWITDCLQSVDLKTTQDARAHEFSKSVANYRYHVQQAFYDDVFYWATGEQLESFDFLAVEKEAPHFNKLYRLDSEATQIGRDEYRKNLDVYAECVKNDDWSLPDGGLEYLALPYWAVPQLEEDDQEVI